MFYNLSDHFQPFDGIKKVNKYTKKKEYKEVIYLRG